MQKAGDVSLCLLSRTKVVLPNPALRDRLDQSDGNTRLRDRKYCNCDLLAVSYVALGNLTGDPGQPDVSLDKLTVDKNFTRQHGCLFANGLMPHSKAQGLVTDQPGHQG